MSEIKRSKGQIITADFMFAVIIILIIIGMTTSAWNRSVYLIGVKNERTEMRRLGLSVSGMLVKSPGIPDDWDNTNVITIGLAKDLNVLDRNKILEFNTLGKTVVQDLLGIRGFDFSFRVRAVNDTVLFDYGNNPTTENDVIVVRRLAIYETEPVYMEFGLWRE